MHIDRRGLLAALGLGAVGGLGLGGCTMANGSLLNGLASQGSKKPNIVWIIADDQAYSDFGFMGNRVVKTPNLDLLAAESAVFPNGYVPSSLCRASLATLITGKYAFDHGICFNDPPKGIPHSETTRLLQLQTPIPVALKSLGYRSMQTGKFWEGAYGNGGFTDGMSLGTRHGDAGLKIGRQTMEPIDTFVKSVDNDPFFLWYAPYLPHAPFDAVESYKQPFRDLGLDERTVGYYANISWLDDTIGDLMALLQANGKADNTIIMFIVDNGWLPNRQGVPVRDLQGRNLLFDIRSKQSPYEDGVRTPVMVRWPGKIQPGKRDDLVSSIDFFPTTLAFAGAPRMPQLPGVDLEPYLLGQATLPPRTIFGEIYYHTSIDLEVPRVNMTHRWARQGKWKLIVNDYDNARPELYDLIADPGEQNDLSAQPEQSQRLASLKAAINTWYPR